MQPYTQALLPTPGAAAKTLASFGHVSLIKFSSRVRGMGARKLTCSQVTVSHHHHHELEV